MPLTDSLDPLSSVLNRLKLETTLAGALQARGDYAVSIGNYEGIKLYLNLKGSFWLKVKGEKRARLIQEGSCVLLPSGRPFRFSKHEKAGKPISIGELAAKAKNGLMTINGEGEYFGVGLHFLFGGHFPKVLFSQLPAVIHVPGDSASSESLRWNIQNFRAEYRSQNFGRSMVLHHLAPVILMQILREHVAAPTLAQDWFVALSDPKLSRAIEVMHREIGTPWTLQSLAKVANMSRSTFAANFRKQVGLYPIEYLTHWRIHVACELLASGETSVAETAAQVGYQSESAFSATFTKIMKCRPGRYGRET